MDNRAPAPPHEINVTATRPDTANGTVGFTRRTLTGTTEHRTIKVRYGGRSAAFLALLAASTVLSFLHYNSYALLAMTFAAFVAAGTAYRFQSQLMWLTGYDRDSKRQN